MVREVNLDISTHPLNSCGQTAGKARNENYCGGVGELRVEELRRDEC